ncbi:metal-dependent hydrolase [Candidatus Kaiserbacteria bacterium]|nr:metal-dependent hydrolase [Candidatus Kaiserbacteria bacterium]MCB9812008.1 metal-dependent hydrolase [Candidatus Nomurabacteria bacterium]
MKNILVLLADWANGIFAVLLASWCTGAEVVWWYFLVGILLAMCPDLDAIPELWRRGKLAASSEHPTDHRDGLHYPIVFIVAGTLLAWWLGFWGFVFLFATLLHFINDLYGTGWGIKLLWPFTSHNYKFLGRRVNRLKFLLVSDGDWAHINTSERRLRLLVSWSKDELPSYIDRWGDEDWIERWYLRLNWISCIEYGLFGIALILAVVTLLY